MEELKSEFFESHPDDPIIFHRKEIMNCKPPFECLKDPMVRKKFDARLLELLTNWDYTVISVCLDKKNHKDTYSVWRYDPYHYCLAMIMERFVFFLESNNSVGDALAESRGGKEDRRLKDSFHRLCQKGTEYFSPERFQGRLTSQQLKVKEKKLNISGLQIADLIAYPSRNEILIENHNFNREPGPFTKKVIQILQNKYYQRYGMIKGFGKKFI